MNSDSVLTGQIPVMESGHVISFLNETKELVKQIEDRVNTFESRLAPFLKEEEPITEKEIAKPDINSISAFARDITITNSRLNSIIASMDYIYKRMDL